VVPKNAATRWAQERLDPRWTALITRAWTGRKNPGEATELAEVNETLEFIRCTLERSQDFEAAQPKPQKQ
jgi:hypothetical protein